MIEDDGPRRRLTGDSPRPENPRPADRHARRLGVLGHVECRPCDGIPADERKDGQRHRLLQLVA